MLTFAPSTCSVCIVDPSPRTFSRSREKGRELISCMISHFLSSKHARTALPACIDVLYKCTRDQSAPWLRQSNASGRTDDPCMCVVQRCMTRSAYMLKRVFPGMEEAPNACTTMGFHVGVLELYWLEVILEDRIYLIAKSTPPLSTARIEPSLTGC
jgi:hypothetical protein